MSAVPLLEQARLESWSDEEVVRRVLGGDTALYEIIMRRHNQRLYRVARAILRSDTEAEDVMQDAYVRAYQHLHQYSGRSAFAAWLIRIAVNEALARLRSRGRIQELEAMINGEDGPVLVSKERSPEQQASTQEMSQLLEEAILTLPPNYRTVLVMRDVDEMTTADTAAALELTEENVKVRLHRARGMLRRELFARAGAGRSTAFPFLGNRCDHMVEMVFQRLASSSAPA